MEHNEARGPTRSYGVARVPSRAPPPNPPAPDDDTDTILTYLWRVYKWIMDHVWFLLMILLGISIHYYLQRVLQLNPEARL